MDPGSGQTEGVVPSLIYLRLLGDNWFRAAGRESPQRARWSLSPVWTGIAANTVKPSTVTHSLCSPSRDNIHGDMYLSEHQAHNVTVAGSDQLQNPRLMPLTLPPAAVTIDFTSRRLRSPDMYGTSTLRTFSGTGRPLRD